jgi:hypothetical protein
MELQRARRPSKHPRAFLHPTIRALHEVPAEDAAMPERGWSATRGRQYRHIKERLLDRGRSEARAGEAGNRTDHQRWNDARRIRIAIPGRSEMAKAGLLLGVDR